MSAKQLAEAMSTANDTVSHDTALRCLHALDARYGGSGHIEHIGLRPTDATYMVHPFGCEHPNQYVREDMIRKTAYVRSGASGRTGAYIRSGAVRTDAKLRTYAPPIPPLIHKTKTTTTNQSAQEANRGGGGGEEVGDGQDRTQRAAPQDAGHGIATSPDAEHGRTEAPAAVPDPHATHADHAARMAALEAAGVASAKKRREYAPRYTVAEIEAAARLARKYSGGGGAVLHELTEGNAAASLKRAASKAAPAPKAERIEAAAAVLATHAADTFNAQQHAERVKGTPWKPLTDAMRAALRKDTAAAAYFIKRNRITRDEIDADDGTPGREKLEAITTHPMIRAAVAAELDAIDQGTPRVVPEGEST